MLSLIGSGADDGVFFLLMLVVVVVLLVVLVLVTLRKFESASIKVLIEGTGSKRGCTSRNIIIFSINSRFHFENSFNLNQLVENCTSQTHINWRQTNMIRPKITLAVQSLLQKVD